MDGLEAKLAENDLIATWASKCHSSKNGKNVMVLKAVWVTNLPVKCQKLTFSGLKAEFIVLHIMDLS